MVETDLVKIAERYLEFKNKLLNEGYTGIYSEFSAIDEVIDELITDLGYMEKPEDVKKIMRMMFLVGETIND